MEKKIVEFNQAIQAKGDYLQEKALRLINAIQLPVPQPAYPVAKMRSSMPPISKICYGIAGVSLVTALCTSKWPFWVCTAVTLWGGYYFHTNKVKSRRKEESYPENTGTCSPENVISSLSQNALADSARFPANEDELKARLAAAMIEVCKQIKNEWEEFMKTTQQELHQAIALLPGDEDRKQGMQAKVYFYDPIDFPLATITQTLQAVPAGSFAEEEVSRVKAQLLRAFTDSIARTVKKQQTLYNSVLTESVEPAG